MMRAYGTWYIFNLISRANTLNFTLSHRSKVITSDAHCMEGSRDPGVEISREPDSWSPKAPVSTSAHISLQQYESGAYQISESCE